MTEPISAYIRGYHAWQRGEPEGANPYSPAIYAEIAGAERNYRLWESGWERAKLEKQRPGKGDWAEQLQHDLQTAENEVATIDSEIYALREQLAQAEQPPPRA